jgi:hypothetical protein
VVDEHAIFEAIREQRQIIEQARKDTRRNVRERRKRERLVQTTPIQNPGDTLTEDNSLAEIKPFNVEEWSC